MPLPTKSDLVTLDFSHLGAPFADVEAKSLSTKTLDVSHLGVPFVGAEAASGGATNYALTCSAGTYTLSGQAATLSAVIRQNYSLSCEYGSYSIAGLSADLVYTSNTNTYSLDCEAGYYTLEGQDASFSTAASTGGGYYDDKPKRKKKVVLHDGKLLEFSSVQEAVSYLNSVTTEDNEPKQEQKPEPVREIRVSEIKTLSEVFDSEDSKLDIINNLEFARFDEILKAYDRWLELDEEEALSLLF